MEKQPIIGIMGPGERATYGNLQQAFELGKKLAQQNYWILTGGRAAGVMEAAMKGAKSANGKTIGILPSDKGVAESAFVDIAIKTGMGSARNNINILTADVVVAIGIGAGTASEIALAIKADKPVILLEPTGETIQFFKQFGYPKLQIAENANVVLQMIQAILPIP